MENPHFLSLIHHLGHDVGYMSRRMEQDLAKYTTDFKTTGDVKRFCRKLAGVLIKFSMYASSYAHTLEDRILSHQLESEFGDVLSTLNELTRKKEKSEQQNGSFDVESDLNSTKQNKAVTTSIHSNCDVDKDSRTEGEPADSDSSQKTVIYNANMELSQLSTSQEISEYELPLNSNYSENAIELFQRLSPTSNKALSCDSKHSILSQKTVPCTDKSDDLEETASDITNVDFHEATQTSDATENSHIFTPPLDENSNQSVDFQIKDTMARLLEDVCNSESNVETVTQFTDEVDTLMEELNNAISDQISEDNLENNNTVTTTMDKVDFFKTLNMVPNNNELTTDNKTCQESETSRKKVNEKDRQTLLKVINQFYVKRLKKRRKKKILAEQDESSCDEMPIEKPSRKNKKHFTLKEVPPKSEEGDVKNDEVVSPTELTDSPTEEPQTTKTSENKSEASQSDKDSLVVLPFRRKVIPLPSSNSELEDDDDVGVMMRKGAKRLRSSSESDLDTLKGFQCKRQKLCSESQATSSHSIFDPAEQSDLDTLQKNRSVQISDSGDSDVEFVSIEPNGQFNLNSSDRDDFLKLLSKGESSTVPTENTTTVPDFDKEVSLGPSQREELLTLFEQASAQARQFNEGEDSGAMSPFRLTEEERDELVQLLKQSSLNDNDILTYDRETLTELIQEFEDSVINELNLSGTMDCEVPSSGSFAGSLDSGSALFDVLREETIEDHLTTKRGRGRPKIHNKDSWEAFEALLESDDDLSCSSSSSEGSECDLTLSLKGLDGKCRRVASQKEKVQFGLDKELFVDVERADFSQFDLNQFEIAKNGASNDGLCKEKEGGQGSSKRKHRLSSTSNSTFSWSDNDADLSLSDEPYTPIRFSEDEEQNRLAASLLDNIRNSSDDEDSPESGITSSTEESEKSSSEKDEENKKVDLDSSDEEDFVGMRKRVAAWKRNPLLNADVSDSESGDSDAEIKSRKRTRKKKCINLDPTSDDSDVEIVNKKSSPLKTFQVDDDSEDDSDFEIVSVHQKEKTPQKVITLSDEEVSKPGKGRRNIRALMEEEDLAEATQRAHNEERERIKRLQEKDKTMESFSQSLSFASQLSEDECNPLILDVHNSTQIKVHPKITKMLKPHQREGIRFMWDSCYESIKQLEAGYKGSGCILAHCMGLGKTLQALALIQTLFANPVTKTKHVLVVCPLSTVSNWKNEYKLAYKGIKDSHVKLYSIENRKAAKLRFDIVNKWRRNGGMLVMGYECFGLMVNEEKMEKWADSGVFDKEDILQALVDPGPDLIICDEGHLLRNKQSQRTLALNKIATKRRIVLTGTPLQNNLLEYYYMVNFVKPNLLGTEKEYKTNFVNPINNGQFEDSTAEDIMFMKKRTHVLHKILNKTVQRVEDTELKQYLPKLIDQALFVKLSDLQVELYNTYLDSTNSRPVIYTKSGNINRKNFLADVQILQYICIHPNVVSTAEKNAKSKIKEQDVIDVTLEDALEEKVIPKGDWYKNLLTSEVTADASVGSKILLALGIVEEAATNGDKVLIFSQSHAEMDNLEKFLTETLHYKNKRDYYRMDGTISPEVRTHMCDRFNSPDNREIKVFIMSTKVGGLGLNLTAANRVIIMSVSWNPSYDTQSVFRAFRFGQNKAVYVYRLIAMDTMEEKMYQRGVTKLAIAHRVVDKHQITRHYNSADIQEYYSVRPTKDKTRPVPNLPEDGILAKLIKKHQVLFKWHEHQALLANRPEEDLDEHQKNAAWEEFNKNDVPVLVNPPSANLNNQNLHNRVLNPVAAQISGHIQTFVAHPDHTYSLPKSGIHFDQRTTSADDFKSAPIRRKLVIPHSLDKLCPTANQAVGNALSAVNFPSKSMLVSPVGLSGNSTIFTNSATTSLKPVINGDKTNQDKQMEPRVRAILHDQIAKMQNAVKEQELKLLAGSKSQKRTPNLQKVTPALIKYTPNSIATSSSTIVSPVSQNITPVLTKCDTILSGTIPTGLQDSVKDLPSVRLPQNLSKTASTLKAKSPSAVQTTNQATSTPSSAYNHLSPLQKQMRSYMEHLHMLQKQNYLNATGNSVPLKAVKNLTYITNPEKNNVGEDSAPKMTRSDNKASLNLGPIKMNPRDPDFLKSVGNSAHMQNHNHLATIKASENRSQIGRAHDKTRTEQSHTPPKAQVQFKTSSMTGPTQPNNMSSKILKHRKHTPKKLNTNTGQTLDLSTRSIVSNGCTPLSASHFSAQTTGGAPQRKNVEGGRGSTPTKAGVNHIHTVNNIKSKVQTLTNAKRERFSKNRKDVTDWIKETIKYASAPNNKHHHRKNLNPISTVADVSQKQPGSALPTLRLPSSPNGTFVKRLVNNKLPVLQKVRTAIQGSPNSSKVHWKSKLPKPDKENRNFSVRSGLTRSYNDLVDTLKKKGVSINYVQSPKDAATGC